MADSTLDSELEAEGRKYRIRLQRLSRPIPKNREEADREAYNDWATRLRDAGYFEPATAPLSAFVSEISAGSPANVIAVFGSIYHAPEKSVLVARRLQNEAAIDGNPVAETFWKERADAFHSMADLEIRLDGSVSSDDWSISGLHGRGVYRERWVLEETLAGYGPLLRKFEVSPQLKGPGPMRSRDKSFVGLCVEIRAMKAEGLTQQEMCERLDQNQKRPPARTTWSEMTWQKAFLAPRHKNAVKKWLSNAGRQPK